MFPPVFPISIHALAPLHSYATLIWLSGVVLLWLTRYTHQLGMRWGGRYYLLSAVVRPAGVVLIALGWLALYAQPIPSPMNTPGWLPRGNWLDALHWLAIALFAALGAWSVAKLGLRRSFLFRRVDDPLITGGPYSLVRHPQFLSVIGMTFFVIQLYNPGEFWSTIYGDPGANWALFTLSLWVLALIEDRELANHFGEGFKSYAQRVPRLFPN
jgi:protein-S-isoprenylcysteine O-methyltransferase Ste14